MSPKNKSYKSSKFSYIPRFCDAVQNRETVPSILNYSLSVLETGNLTNFSGSAHQDETIHNEPFHCTSALTISLYNFSVIMCDGLKTMSLSTYMNLIKLKNSKASLIEMSTHQ